MNRRILAVGFAFAAALLAVTADAADRHDLPPMCEVPDDMIADSSPLSNAARQIRAERRLKIVALGSSSTLGMGASGPNAAYPARLEAALAELLPSGVTVQVVNKGVARQSAEQMIDRFVSDVLSEKPSLVVWETGTSEAVRGAEVDQFMLRMLAGIDRLTAEKIDVVLVDTQYNRNTAQLINFQPYVVAMEQIAGVRNLILFPRFSVMRHWADEGRFDFGGKSPQERRHITDEIYDCIGRLLAQGIVEGLKRLR